MNFSSDARNAFGRRKRPAPDLVPRPLYGNLYLLGLYCGHTIFSSGDTDWMACPLCGESDVVMASMRVRRG